MSRLQLETDILWSLIFDESLWQQVPENFGDLFQTPDYRELVKEFLAWSDGSRSASAWTEFSKCNSRFAPLLHDIFQHGRSVNGDFERHIQAMISGELPPIGSLADYLSRVENFLRRYVVFPSQHEPTAVALWIAHAWIVEKFDISPILVITSAEMRCGKSRLLDLLQLIVPNAWRVITPSEAVVFRMLQQRPRPTMLLDEADAIFGPRTSERNEGLRAILNSGNAVGSPVPRVKINRKGIEGIELFDVFGPKAIAAIGSLPATITDRGILIRLKRRAPDERIEKFRRRIASAEAKTLCFDWNSVIVPSDVSVPEGLNDRQCDSWEVLIAIADAAGGDWPDRARRAAVALSDEEESISIGMKLLADIKEVFGEENHIEVGVLLERLHELETWSDFYGRPLTKKALARLLGNYRIKSRLTRATGKPERLYFRADFEDAWKRYVAESVTNVTSVTETENVTDVTDVTVPQKGGLPF